MKKLLSILSICLVFVSCTSTPEEVTEEPCEGYKDCSYEVRQKLEGAGWQLAGDVLYYGNGVHYAVGAKPMETGVKEIYYTMDCNCQPKDVKFK